METFHIDRKIYEEALKSYQDNSSLDYSKDQLEVIFRRKVNKEILAMSRHIYECAAIGICDFSAVNVTHFGKKNIPKIIELFATIFADNGHPLFYMQFGSTKPCWYWERTGLYPFDRLPQKKQDVLKTPTEQCLDTINHVFGFPDYIF